MFGHCSNEKEPPLFEGTANIIITDGVTKDTLNTCYCWRSADTVAIDIFRAHTFSGMSIIISNKHGRHSTWLKYYSDYNQFDGQNDLPTTLIQDKASITYDVLGDSVNIKGQVNLETDVVDYFKDGRKVKADGTFNCKMDN